MEFNYIENNEQKSLTIETRIDQFKNDENVQNPTGDIEAYFYWITVNGFEQLTTFAPGEEWYQPMTEEQAIAYVEAEIKQTKNNFGIPN